MSKEKKKTTEFFQILKQGGPKVNFFRTQTLTKTYVQTPNVTQTSSFVIKLWEQADLEHAIHTFPRPFIV